MRFKPLPPAPSSLAEIARAQRGIPLVPAPEADCCVRIANELECPREDARAWITVLRALDLAEETPSGYVRRGEIPDRDGLAERFRRRVYGAQEVLDALDQADGPLDVRAIAAATSTAQSRWEHDRRQDPAAAWRERVRTLLEWATLLGLVEHSDGQYRPTN